jgi:hypothetical protein
MASDPFHSCVYILCLYSAVYRPDNILSLQTFLHKNATYHMCNNYNDLFCLTEEIIIELFFNRISINMCQ